MTILSKVVEFIGKVDEFKGVAETVQKIIDANNASEVVAASGQLAAEVAVGVVANMTLRTAFSGLRLGLAVSGQGWKCGLMGSESFFYGLMGSESFFNN